MPSGYTSALYDGKPVTFPEFAMSCARAFGALITMRDDPADAPIPYEFVPDDYYAKRLLEARERLASLRAMTDDEVAAAAATANAEALSHWQDSEARSFARRQRYEAMLAEVEAWMPPTEEHQELKAFMVKQILDSMRFDCFTYERPVEQTPAGWLNSEIDAARKDIAYYTEERSKEAERAASRTAWVQALRSSLAEVAR